MSLPLEAVAPPAIDSILGAIGGTPLLALGRLQPPGAARLLLKCEQLEPAGSVKDRIALEMIRQAEARGELKEGGTVIEPTSGNTGVGLALVCAARGYRCVLTMPADMSLERRQLLESFGAEVILTEPAAFMEGAISAAEDLLAATPGAFMPAQFENPDNPRAHREHTAPEIIEALEGEAARAGGEARLDAVVVGVGTGGTLGGIAGPLRERFPGVRLVAVEPEGSAVLSGGAPGLHRIQGIGAGFVPAVVDRGAHDEVRAVGDRAAWEMRGRLAREEGLMVGISSGANVVVALEVAATLPPEAVVLTFLCDTGERYHSLATFFDEDVSR
ncbi:MAG: cysteine synthase A [Deltaproteobacteria bacterium]|nr:cysteine synthase A [Deltaproteobacteria bacterium]